MDSLNISYSINIKISKGEQTITLTKEELTYLVNSALHNSPFKVISTDY